MVIHAPSKNQLFLHCEIPRNCWKKLTISAEGRQEKVAKIVQYGLPHDF